MRNRPFARLLAGLIAISALAGPSVGQEAPPPATPAILDLRHAETLGYVPEANARMTVGVTIAGRGPFPFIVDTGAERTIISAELARSLALVPGRTAIVHSMSEVSRIATVVIPSLRVGSRSVDGIHAPALARANLGAAGILGVDSLRNQRVTFDFRRQEMIVTPAHRREERWSDQNVIVVTGRSLFGRLVLVDAALDGQRIWVIIDTGAEISVGNSALRSALARRNRLGAMAPVQMISITGGLISAEYSIARRIQIGGADIRNLPVAFAEVHPFRQLGLTDRPALLLGMDALRLFDRVSVDFANRRVRVQVNNGAMLFQPARVAGVAQPRRAR